MFEEKIEQTVFFTLDRSMPCQWKQQKFEDTCRKCNSRRRVNQVSSKYWPNVGGLLIDMSTDSQSTYRLTCWPTCPVTSWLLVNWVLADMSTDQVYPPIVSTDTWPRGAQTSQDLHPLQNYHPCRLGNLAVLDQIVHLTGTIKPLTKNKISLSILRWSLWIKAGVISGTVHAHACFLLLNQHSVLSFL